VNTFKLSLMLCGVLMAYPLQSVRADDTVGQKVDSAMVTAHVKAALASDKGTPAHRIHVKTHEGVVTLSGTVASDAERARAEELAAGIKGVTKVDNELTVGTERTTKQKVSDASITTKVKAALVADELTKARDIHVRTRAHVVTLTGVVESNAERDKAVSLAKNVEGVSEVKDKMAMTASN
jgi:hyperosmotically inducible periplasmic protein